MKRTIYLLRHGETDWNAAGRLQGHTDTPLNEKGREQARRAAELLREHPIGHTISSDLSRARETADIVAHTLGIRVDVDPALRERCFGIFEGLTWQEVSERYPQHHAAYMDDRTTRVPGAETLEEVGQRTLHAVRNRLVHATVERTILVVTHGGVMRSLIGNVWKPGPGRPSAVPNAVPFRVVLEHGVIVAAEALGP
ncbi:MAG: histidine phosphatase family protein [Myxococcota bacterium]